jgi:outer membrane protein
MKCTSTLCKLFLVLIFSSQAAFAQKYYSLEECITLAFKNNLTIKQRELNQRSSQSDRQQSKLNLLPSINGSATHNYNIGYAINPVTNTATRDATFRNNSFGVNGSLVLFNGFQNMNTIRQREAVVQASDADLNATKNNIALSVSDAYLQVLMNQEIVQARAYQLESTTEQLKRQQRLYELGGTSKVKLLQLKAQFASEESQLVTAQTQLDQSYLTLWQLLDMNPDSNNKLVEPDSASLMNIVKETPEADEIYQAFVSRSPDVIAAKKRTEASKYNQYIATGGRSPRLTLSGGLNSFYTTQAHRGVGAPTIVPVPIGVDALGNPAPYYTSFNTYSSTQVVPFNEQMDKNFGKNFGFTLSIPILNGWQVNNNIQKSRIDQTSTELTQKQTEQDLYKNINQAYLDFVSAQKKYESNMNNFEANKESMDLAEAQFSLGGLNTSDFIVSKTQFLQAETSLVQAKYELLFRRKVLDFYLGKPLY